MTGLPMTGLRLSPFISCALLLLVWATAAPAQQRDTLPVRDTVPALGLHVRGEVGAVLGHDVLRETTVETTTGVGALLRAGVEYRFRRGLGAYGMLGGSLARVTVSEALVAERTGTATQIDLLGGLTWRPPIRQAEPEPVILHIAGGASWPGGPESIPPYATMGDNTPFEMWEVGISVRAQQPAVGAMVALQSVSVVPRVSESESSMRRVLLAVRLGW
jgi:hypothetical protein